MSHLNFITLSPIEAEVHYQMKMVARIRTFSSIVYFLVYVSEISVRQTTITYIRDTVL